VTLFLAGDVMTGRGIDQILAHPSDPELREPYLGSARDYVALAEAAHGRVSAPVAPEYIWGDALGVLSRFRPAASIVNLETSITLSNDFWPGKGIHYRMHPRNVGCIQAAGVDVCVLANNHVLDFGRSGLLETIQTLRAAGLSFAGAGRDLEEARRPARVEVAGNATVLVFAFGTESSGIPVEWAAGRNRPGVHLLPDLSTATAVDVTDRIQHGKRPGDLVVASIHWGSNWGYEVPAEQQAFAHALLDRGVDVVHGHSSHHVRPVELRGGRLILHGCGDLVTDYEGIRGHEAWRGDLGAMHFVTVAARDGALVQLRAVPVRMRRLRLELAPATDREWLQRTWNRISQRFGARVGQEEDGVLVLRGGGGGDARSPLPGQPRVGTASG
jgi:poly-gamma-glutamate synthesis protein (capsule biosynthesis protein)